MANKLKDKCFVIFEGDKAPVPGRRVEDLGGVWGVEFPPTRGIFHIVKEDVFDSEKEAIEALAKR